jgi:hypothetical protein
MSKSASYFDLKRPHFPTFRGTPPYYARCGFRILATTELTPGLHQSDAKKQHTASTSGPASACAATYNLRAAFGLGLRAGARVRLSAGRAPR